MNVFDAIETRRSVKHFDPDFKMPEEDEKRILELAILSPTAFNIQNWRFVHVKDPELRNQIRAQAWDQAQVTDASMLLILTADLNAWDRDPGRYWTKAPAEVQDILVPAITGYYKDREQVHRDEAMRSCGIAAQTLLLAATGMGYHCCPMDGFDFDEVGKLINLPEDHTIAMFVVIGKGIKDPWPRPGQLPLSDVVIEDRF